MLRKTNLSVWIFFFFFGSRTKKQIKIFLFCDWFTLSAFVLSSSSGTAELSKTHQNSNRLEIQMGVVFKVVSLFSWLGKMFRSSNGGSQAFFGPLYRTIRPLIGLKNKHQIFFLNYFYKYQ